MSTRPMLRKSRTSHQSKIQSTRDSNNSNICPNHNNGKRHKQNNTFCTNGVLMLWLCIFALCGIIFILSSKLFDGAVNEHENVLTDDGSSIPITNNNDDDAFKKQYFDHDKNEIDNRFITNIILDKPIYRPSEIIYLTGFLFGAISMMPYQSKNGNMEYIQIQIIDAKDIVIVDESTRINLKNSMISLQYQIPSSLRGGEYKIKIKFNNQRFNSPSSIRKFTILNSNNKMNPKIRKQITFLKKVYSVGEECKLKISCIDCGNNILITSIIAKIDNNLVKKFTNNDGLPLQLTNENNNEDNIQSVIISFKMPDIIDEGNGNVAVSYQDNSIIETLTKTIPIALNYLNIHQYPESNNYLIPGLNNQRIYFEGFNPKTNEPADYSGDIISLPDEQIISNVISKHEGRAVSDYFNVEKNKKYALRLISPLSCKGQIISLNITANKDMELIKERAVLSSTKSAYKFDDEIDIKIGVNIRGIYKIKLFKRESLITNTDITIGDINKIYDIKLDKTHLKNNDIGILRITVYDNNDIPIAERLIFRHSHSFVQFEVDFKVISDSDQYDDNKKLKKPSIKLQNETIVSPSDGIEVSIYSYLVDLNNFGKTAVSIKGNVFVTDDSLSSIIDNRLLPPRLPSSVLFESEVDHLEDANIYLPYYSSQITPEEIETSNIYIDLLLGTQGWRRFSYKHMTQFFKDCSGDNLEKKERLFAIKQYTMNKNIHFHAEHMQRMNFMRAERGMNMEKIHDVPQNNMIMEHMEMGMNLDNMIMEEKLEAENDENDEADDMMPAIIIPERKARKRKIKNPSKNGIFYERVYAKNQRKFSKKEFNDGIVRNDFESTVYVSRDIETICYDNNYCGQSFRFGLSDIIGIYKIFIDGYSFNIDNKMISFGSNYFNIKTELPIEIDVLIPSILMAGDQPLIPVMIQSSTKQDIDIEINIHCNNKTILQLTNHNPNQRETAKNIKFFRGYIKLQSFNVNNNINDNYKNKANVIISASNNKYKDSIKKETEVIIGGFEETVSSGGIIGGLDKNNEKELEFILPSDYIDNTLNIDVKGYLSPVGQLNEAIKHLIKEPCGCFEQTSSTTYPLVMALKYMNSRRRNFDMSSINKAKDMLRRGYKKLISYESKGGGFEWFGGSPGHEALTAYGILQFSAMSSNDMDMNGLVDEIMLKRTIKWLLERKDNNGGYKRNSKSLDSFGAAPVDTTNAYITWSLVKAGLIKKEDMNQEINSLIKLAKETSDSYIIALAALTMFDIDNNNNEGINFLNRLILMQDQNTGLIKQIENTITNSGGKAKDIEATALSSLAFMASKNDSYAPNIRLAIDFLTSNCKNGAFSSTQSTALSLQAIVEYDKFFSKQIESGTLELYIDNELMEALPFGIDDNHSFSPVLLFNNVKINKYLSSSNLKDSKHNIKLKLSRSGKSKLPYSIYVSYKLLNPKTKNSDKISINLKTKLLINSASSAFNTVKEGDVITLNVELTNLRENKDAAMVVAIVGIPGGCELRIDQLRELKQSDNISFYETTPNELILYFRFIEKGKKLIIPIELIAVIPGKYTSSASRAYLFYTSEYKSWSNSININIEPNIELSFDKQEINYLFQ